MCGLFAAFPVSIQGELIESKAAGSLRQLSHRGPDGSACFINSGMVLGHTRLSFLDLSEHANQPFSDASGRYKLVYNGEIYNFRMLREELQGKGFEFRTGSDTEVLLYGLIVYGEEFLSRLEGMFAFVMVDTERREFIAARDRFGIKPLYYVESSDGLFFASEIKALSSWVPPVPDDLTISAFISGHYLQTSERSFVRGVRFFPTGQYVKGRLGQKLVFESFFDLPDFYNKDYASALASCSKEDLVERCEELLLASVEKHMISDVQVGALCSGGVDSSLILAMASKNNSNLRIFHANVAGPHSETEAAKFLARHLKLKLDVVEAHDEDFLALMPQVIRHLEFPFIYHPNSVPFLQVARLVRSNGVKAVLTGEGADEALLGYADLPLAPYINAYHGVLDKLRGLVHRVPWVGRVLWRNPEFKQGMLGLLNGFDAEMPPEWLERVINKGFDQRDVKETMPLLSYHLRTLLMRNDRLGMAASIEARFPFLDHDFVKFCVNLPRSFKIRFSCSAAHEIRHPFLSTKWILRQVANKYLPVELSQRRKRGFPTNAMDRVDVGINYFRGSWIADYLELSNEKISLLNQELKREEVLRLVMLDLWGRIFIEEDSSDLAGLVRKHLHFG